MKTIIFGIFRVSAIFILILSACSSKNLPLENNRTRQLLESKNFLFRANYVLPMRGSSIPLTSNYDLSVTSQTISATLPYFGRAFVAPMNPAEGGIRFESKDFNYDLKEKRKGGWVINITPNDVQTVRNMYLRVSADGGATLQVLSNNREPISFNGTLVKK